MLYVSRRPGEKIIINGGQIEIIVSRHPSRNSIRFGIHADRSVTIDREEVHLKKNKNNTIANHCW